MVDPILQRAAQKIAEQAPQQPEPRREDVSAHDQSRFEDLVNRPQDGVNDQAINAHEQGDPAVQDTSRAEIPSDIRGGSKDETIEQAAMRKIEDVKRTYDAESQQLEQKLSNADGMSPQDLLAAQMQMANMNVELQFVTKVADKASKGVESLANRNS